MSDYQPYPPQQPTYPPAGYSYPPPTPPVKPGRGLAITSLVLGIVGAAMGIVPLFCWMALVLGLLGLIFGIVGRRHGMGKAGIVLSLLSLTLGVIGAVILANAVHDVSNDLNSLGTVPTASLPTIDTASSDDQAFLDTVHQAGIWTGVPDATLINDAQLACNALDAGNSYLSVVQIAMDSGGLDAYDAGYFVGASIGVYCPADAYLIPGN